MDWKSWFEENPISYRQIVIGMYKAVNTEELYQAFKQRLIEETTVCELPKGE